MTRIISSPHLWEQLGPSIKVIGEETGRWDRKLQEQIDQLRVEVETLRGIVKGEVTPIRGRDVA